MFRKGVVLSLKDFYYCLSYSFNISYIEYDYEGWNDDAHVIYYPEYFLKSFEDAEMLELLFFFFSNYFIRESELMQIVKTPRLLPTISAI